MEIQPQSNPFPGLRAFFAEEDYLFFGREEQVNELLSRLRQHRFLSVLGASGSGKSSLVRAGMLPALEGGAMTSAGSFWEIGVMRPGGNPIQNLAKILFEMDLYDFDESEAIFHLQATLKRSGLGLVEAIKQSEIEEGANLLIVVDQFEELFRFSHSGQAQDEIAAAFVKLLLEASRQSDIPIYVVITMRSDYIGDCAQFPDLTESVNESEYLVPRLKRDQRRTAIEGPIKVAGGEITSRLTQKLLNDFGNDPDQLPVLQHLLMRMWDKWVETRGPDDPLDLQHYENIGGMEGALSQHADEVFLESVDEDEKQATKKLFQALTEKGGDNRGIRRPTRLDELYDIVGVESDILKTVVERFRKPGRTFLMPPVEVVLEDDTVVDISHESLMRVWVNLRQWVETESQSARIFVRLAETAQLHADDKAGLYSDPDLQIALSWRDEAKPNEAWGCRYHTEYDRAIGFLNQSAEAKQRIEQEKEEGRQRELEQAKRLAKAEKARAEEQERSAGKLRKLAAVVGLAAVLAMVATVFALDAREEAQVNALNAEKASLEAEKSAEEAKRLAKLADEAKFKAEGSLIDLAGRSVLNYSRNIQTNNNQVALAWLNDAVNSVQGVPRAKRQMVGVISDHLKSAPLLINRIKVGGRAWKGGDGYAVSRDGKWIAATSWTGPGKDIVNHRGVTVQNVVTLETLEIPVEPNIHSAALSADGKHVAANAWGIGSQIWEIPSGKPVGKPLKGSDDPSSGYFAVSKDFHPAKPILACVFGWRTGGVVEAYNYMEDKTVLNRFAISNTGGVRSQTFFTENGDYLVASISKTLSIFSTKTWQPIMPPISFKAQSITVKEIPAQSRLLILKNDVITKNKNTSSPFIVTSLADGSLSGFDMNNSKQYSNFEFSSNGKWLAMSRPNGSVEVYHTKNFKSFLNLTRVGAQISMMTFSSSGRYLAVSRDDKSLQIIDIDDSGRIIHQFNVNYEVAFLQFLPNREERLYIGDKEGEGQMYALKTTLLRNSVAEMHNTPKEFLDEWKYSISPNQQWVVASRNDGWCVLSDIKNNQAMESFQIPEGIESISWNENSNRVCLLGLSGRIVAVSIRDKQRTELIGSWTQLSLSPDGNRLAAVDKVNTLVVHDLAQGAEVDRMEMNYPLSLLEWQGNNVIYYSDQIGDFTELQIIDVLEKKRVAKLSELTLEKHSIPGQNNFLLASSNSLIRFEEDEFRVAERKGFLESIERVSVLPDGSGAFLILSQSKTLAYVDLKSMNELRRIPSLSLIQDYNYNPYSNSVLALTDQGKFENWNITRLVRLPVSFSLQNISFIRRLVSRGENKIFFVGTKGHLHSFNNQIISKNEQLMLDYAAWLPGRYINKEGLDEANPLPQIKSLGDEIRSSLSTIVNAVELEPITKLPTDTSSVPAYNSAKLVQALKRSNSKEAISLSEKLSQQASSSADPHFVSEAILSRAVLGLPVNTLTNKAEMLRSSIGGESDKYVTFEIPDKEWKDGNATFSFWYFTDFHKDQAQVVLANETVSNTGISFFQDNHQLITLRFEKSFIPIRSRSIKLSTVSLSNWVHVAATIDANNRMIRCYLNGEERAGLGRSIGKSVNFSEQLSGKYSIGQSMIAKNSDGKFLGEIARLSAWNRVLTSEEILEDRNNGLRLDPNLKICLVNDPEVKDVLKDVSGNGLDVQLPKSAGITPFLQNPHVLLGSRDLGITLNGGLHDQRLICALGFLYLDRHNINKAEDLFMRSANISRTNPSDTVSSRLDRGTFNGLALLGLAQVAKVREDQDFETECLTRLSTVEGSQNGFIEAALIRYAKRKYAIPLTPKREPVEGSKQLDLRPFFNQRIGDNLAYNFVGAKDDITGMNLGLNMISGIPTQIEGAIKMQWKGRNYLKYPRIIKGVKVDRKIARVICLHTAIDYSWDSLGDLPILIYHLVYKDGTRASFPVLNKKNIGTWTSFDPGKMKKTDTVSSGLAKKISNAATVAVEQTRYLYHFKITNPNPAKPVSTIEIESTCTSIAPYVLAITVE